METAGQYANELSRTVKLSSGVRANLSGSVVDYGSMLSAIPPLPALAYTLDNSVPVVNTDYIIGDPSGMIAAATGLTLENPDLLNGVANRVVPNKQMFFGSSILFSEINWQTSSTTSQFAQTPIIYVTNHNGDVVPKPIVLSMAKRNTAQDILLLTTKGKVRLDQFRGLKVTVLAGEIFTITMAPAAYTT